MNTLTLSFLLGIIASLEGSRLEDRSTFECKEEGRFRDLSDCGFFFECIPDEEGSLKAYRRSCHGDGFNPQTLSCTDPSKIKGCKIRRSRHYYPAQYNALCINPEVKYACADCGTVIMCNDGKAHPIKCEDQFRCVTGPEKFDGAVCYPKYSKFCQCREANTYYQDPYNNATFFLCKEKNAVPLFYHCPPDMHFNHKTSTCLSADGLPGCTESGIFIHPMDCRKYYTCTFALEGWLQTRFTCPESKLFNKYTNVCENPCKWPKSEFKCTRVGRFRNPKNCNQFFECIPDGHGGLTQIQRTCPPNYDWNIQSKICIRSVDSDCKPQAESPIEQCQSDYNAICGLTTTTEHPHTTWAPTANITGVSNKIMDESEVTPEVTTLPTI